jgi:hypothetical protein
LAGESGPNDAGSTGELDRVVYGAVRGLCEPDGASLGGWGIGPLNGKVWRGHG